MSSDEVHLTGAEFLADMTQRALRAGCAEIAGRNGRAIEQTQPRRSPTPSPIFRIGARRPTRSRAYAIANLDKLLVEFERNIAARGATVLWAKDAAEANRHVLDIAREHNVRSVVKSKSMVSEEMELNQVLEAAGIRAVETDLGEYIVQLAQPAAGPHRHARHPHVGRRRGPPVCRKAGRAVHRRTSAASPTSPAGTSAKSICGPAWAFRAAISPWPRRARWW